MPPKNIQNAGDLPDRTREVFQQPSAVAFPGSADISVGRVLRVVRWSSVIVILLSLLMIVRALPIDQAMEALHAWVAGFGIWGPVVLSAVYVLATVLFVPGTILTLAAGAAFGLPVGLVAVSIGSTVGASLAFLIARYAARDKIAAIADKHRRFGAIDRAIGEGGWKIVALLRLSPAIPFNVQNYLYGLTRIRFMPYVVTSWIAMLPGTFLYVYLGHVTGAALGADRERGSWEWAMLAVGLLATVAVTIYVTRLAHHKLQEQMETKSEANAPLNATHSDRHRAIHAQSARTTFRLVVAALLLVAAAAYVRANSARIEHWLASRSGPPQVVLKELSASVAGQPRERMATLIRHSVP